MWETSKKFCLKWLPIIMMIIMVPCQEIKQAKTPLLPHKPFIVVWNAPTEQCKLRFNMDLDLSVFDIVANSNETLSGSNVTIFYHTQLGYYPYFTDNGDPMNGGIPQNQSLLKHLDKAKSDIDRFIPLKNFHGLGVIDWEDWRPQWDRNWGNKTIYRNKSIELVKARYPHWSDDKILKVAKEEFEMAGTSLMNSTLLVAKQLRPDGFWGYYLYPDCYNYDYKEQPHTYTGECPNLEVLRNDRLLWLWKESSALFPSIYLDFILKSSPNALKFVNHRIKEAIRVASMAGKDCVLPIFPYARPFYSHTLQVLTETDLVNTIGESAALGSAGIVLWGSIQYASSQDSCSTVKKYINGQLGHYVINVTSAAKLCSKVLCRKNGRCVRKTTDSSAYLHLNPASFKIQTIFSGRGPRFQVRGKAKEMDVGAMKENFLCHCYEGWTGFFCELPVPRSTTPLTFTVHSGASKGIPHRSVILTTAVQVLFFTVL
ncbi:hyaluronidase [Microcaecilia unicolor]|uniref:Hyaluronidase n=1 Tax=Microcaecilia unicolor TaxID=1415580 RepID=A0A6P7ZB40_9AMPH|nr:hyaluronidase-like [Microcaecilia unicolor]XP_030072871.1 hyaluronidase-like [Microcaecilia unicolor]XP_030072872.1 hyaluronidase-like [Microcaecilia unicolor]XP_030072873.1 hyaluronidase-like [Microcaecilia unicolor]XP_030072874.1 hyaluronidase-like [Microcaecilia unicolor]XP_030072876.1 hyaluronidase-like [Microcaecilia unicolor]XP_030072877.1 hyaluronidase-like [Microcaecilia unicolor]